MNFSRLLIIVVVLFYIIGCDCDIRRTISAGTYSGTWTIDPSTDNVESAKTLNANLTITNKVDHCVEGSGWWTFNGTLTVTQEDQTASLTLRDGIGLTTEGSFRFFVDINGTFLQSLLPGPIDPDPEDADDTELEIMGEETNGNSMATAYAFTIVSPAPTYGTFNLVLE